MTICFTFLICTVNKLLYGDIADFHTVPSNALKNPHEHLLLQEMQPNSILAGVRLWQRNVAQTPSVHSWVPWSSGQRVWLQITAYAVTDTSIQLMFVHSSSHWPEAQNAYAAFKKAEVLWSSSQFNKKEKVYTNTALVTQNFLMGWPSECSTTTLITCSCILRELTACGCADSHCGRALIT